MIAPEVKQEPSGKTAFVSYTPKLLRSHPTLSFNYDNI